MGRVDHRRIIRIGRKNDWPPPEWTSLPGAWHWFGSGREALVALIRTPRFNNPAGKTVLLPAFCPEGVFAPFQREGWRIRFYDLDVPGNPVLEQVKTQAAVEKPAIAVLIHLFGIPRDVASFRATVGGDVFLIEDFAHTWPGEHLKLRPAPNGAALFSLPKLGGLPDGGGLFIQDPDICPGRRRSVKRWGYILLRIASLWVSTLAWRLDSGWLRFLAAALNGRAYSLLQSAFLNPHRISFAGRFLLRRFDHQTLIEAHLRQAALYRQALGHLSPASLRSTLPWPMIGFPILVNGRPEWIRYLAQNGINVLVFTDRWNFVPDSVRDGFHGAAALEKNHILLPVNPKLSDEDIRKVIRTVERFFPPGTSAQDSTAAGKQEPG